ERLAAQQLVLPTHRYPLPSGEREGAHAQHGKGEGVATLSGLASPRCVDAPSPRPSPQEERGNRGIISFLPSPACGGGQSGGSQPPALGTDHPPPRSSPAGGGGGRASIIDEAALAALVDRLDNRLGLGAVRRLAPYESHLPERAIRPLP